MGRDTTKSTLVGAIERRLPGGDLLSLADVAAAFSVNEKTAKAWIEEGAIEAINLGSGAKARWMFFRPSVLSFLRERTSA